MHVSGEGAAKKIILEVYKDVRERQFKRKKILRSIRQQSQVCFQIVNFEFSALVKVISGYFTVFSPFAEVNELRFLTKYFHVLNLVP
jgi:hypothetical protein